MINGEVAMARAGRRGGSRGRDDDDKDRDDREPERHHENGSSDEDEEYDNPAEHLEIERRRFAGGLQPTPVNPQDREPAFARDRLEPVAFFAFRRSRSEIDVIGAVRVLLEPLGLASDRREFLAGL